uniref:Uncharacterized protein n=1 Tax=Guillardia theta TaxID=55529 RepID=A0A7S4PEG2_GUITH|mmetsp:Transcript_49212/g.154457  ORF Transcript_49212/g.154457 Transcript_49212/m.154457 type:complete len:479 (+) Transcript_49212:58-1494(+)
MPVSPPRLVMSIVLRALVSPTPSRPPRSPRLLKPSSIALMTIVALVLLESCQPKFAPRWTAAGPSKSNMKEPSAPVDQAPGTSDGVCHDRQCEELKAAETTPEDSPFPPPYSTTLSIPVRAEDQTSSDAVPDHRTSSLHVPPGTVFYHGVTVGMTVVARDKYSKVVAVKGAPPFLINVTDVGDTNTGSFFDLRNGTYFIYTTIYFSPALLKAKAPEVWVRLGGKHIQGSPYRMTIDMTKIARNYQERVALAEKVGRSHDLGGPNGCDSDFVIVTGASTSMFDRAVNLVGSIHHWAPAVPVVFYDLGLSTAQVEDVRTWENVDYRKFAFNEHAAHMRVDEKLTQNGTKGAYSWRAPILVEVLEQHQCMLWLDAGLEIRSDLSVVIGHIAVDGNFFVTNGWPSPNRFTHPAVVEWHGLKEKDFFLPDPTGTGMRNEIEACGGIQGYRRGSLAHREVLSGYYICLMDPTCIATSLLCAEEG